jgi:hypothetical protein
MYFLSYIRIINVDENGQIKLHVPLKRTIKMLNDKDFVRFRFSSNNKTLNARLRDTSLSQELHYCS